MMRSNLARSLALAMGLALTLPVALYPAYAQGREQERGAATMRHTVQQEQQSGASDLMIAYENTLMAHMDASLGHNDLAQGHLNVARQHLEHANRLLGGTVSIPNTERGKAPGMMRGGGGGPEEDQTPQQMEERIAPPEAPETPDEIRGGGGGPTRGPLSNLETMMRTTEEDLNAENTNRLVAAFTNELSRLSRIGGGGGPEMKTQSLANKITSVEHLGLAYASTGRAAGSTAIQDWEEAKAAIDDAKRHVDHAKKAPGNIAMKAQLDRADKALKDAEGPIKAKSAQATEATSRAIRELTMAISSLPQAQTEGSQGGTPTVR